MAQRLPGDEAPQFVGHPCAHTADFPVHAAGDVRGENHIGQIEERRARIEGLALHHIEHGGEVRPRREHSDKVALDHDGTPRRIDQGGAGFHQLEQPPVDEPGGFGQERGMNAHDIRRAKNFLEGDERRTLPRRDKGIVSDKIDIQRDDKNGAAVPLQLTAAAEISDVRYRVLDQKTKSVVQDWQPFAAGATMRLPAGWYTLELTAKKAGQPVTASVEHFGVGEVFLTAGQSNSGNYGFPRQKPSDDRVSAFDWETGLWRHADDPQPGAAGDGGSAWPALGDALTAKYHVPVGIASMGIGSTRALQWIPTRPGTFFNRIAIALNRLKPFGARAFLWHQGESDAINGTKPAEYFEMMKSTIEESRKVAGYPLPWGIALASFHPDAKATVENQAAIVEGQKRVIAEIPGVFQGAETNSFHERALLYGGVHFNDAGLKEHGRLWAAALEPILPKP